MTRKSIKQHEPLVSRSNPSRFAIRHRSGHELGFTLIEFSVAVAIFITLFAVVMSSYRTAMRTKNLLAASSQLVADVRNVQALALAAQILDPPGPLFGVPFGGYGISFPNPNAGQQNYTIFADWNGNHDLSGSAEVMESRRLPGEVRFHSINGGSGGSSRPTILFCPPYAITLLYNWNDDVTTAVRGQSTSSYCRGGPGLDAVMTITLRATNNPAPLPNELVTITVFATGAVEIH